MRSKIKENDEPNWRLQFPETKLFRFIQTHFAQPVVQSAACLSVRVLFTCSNKKEELLCQKLKLIKLEKGSTLQSLDSYMCALLLDKTNRFLIIRCYWVKESHFSFHRNLFDRDIN